MGRGAIRSVGEDTKRMEKMQQATDNNFVVYKNWRKFLRDLGESSIDVWTHCVPVWEAAYRLEASERTVRRRIAEGHLHALKVGNQLRIDPATLEELVHGWHPLSGKRSEPTLLERITILRLQRMVRA